MRYGTNIMRVRKPHSRYVDEILKNGFADNIPVGSALVLLRHHKNLVTIKSKKNNLFFGVLGKRIFKARDETEKYKFYEMNGKLWRDVV